MSDLIKIHLHTHKSSSEHSMRAKYKSAIYYFNAEQMRIVQNILGDLKYKHEGKIITKVLAYHTFRTSLKKFKDYYYTGPEKPFCKRYIAPKLKMMLSNFTEFLDHKKFSHLN